MVGSHIAHYQLIRQIGSGGMGTVYEALDEHKNERVAIKVLRRDLAHNREALTRFLNEARATSLIDHPSLVKVYDSGTIPAGDAFLVMELLEGDTLSARLRGQNGLPMPEDDVRLIGWQLASALAAAHKQGIIHRDLKPGNILVVPEKGTPGVERVKLLDFGVAKLDARRHNLEDPKTREGSIMGTPKYMSPEQCRGASDVDGASDVYSLGLIFFEMLTGRHPFAGTESDSEGMIIAMQIYEPVPPPRKSTPAISEQMDRLVSAMLKKDRTQRPTMSEVCSVLEENSEDTGPSVANLPSTLGGGAAELSDVTQFFRQNSTLLKIAGAVFAAAFIAVISFQLGRQQTVVQPLPPPPPPVTEPQNPPPAPPPVKEPPTATPTEEPSKTKQGGDRKKPGAKADDEEQPKKRKRKSKKNPDSDAE